MNAFTVVVTGSIVCSLAYAAHQGRPVSAQPDGAGNRSVSHEGLVLGQRPKAHAMAALGGGGECTIGEPLNWFTNVHVLPECNNSLWVFAGLAGGHANVDVDGDGTTDRLVYLKTLTDGDGVITLVNAEQITTSANPSAEYACCVGDKVLFLLRTELTGQGVATTIYPVLSGALLEEAACRLGLCTDPDIDNFFSVAALHDIDGDGDMDLVMRAQSVWTGGYQDRWIWIENTVKANPPLAADINQDGVVDGKDLAAVLAAWTP